MTVAAVIDWETAYRNDPVVDIAIMTMYVANTPELQEALIRAWLGRPSDELLRARLDPLVGQRHLTAAEFQRRYDQA